MTINPIERLESIALSVSLDILYATRQCQMAREASRDAFVRCCLSRAIDALDHARRAGEVIVDDEPTLTDLPTGIR